MLVATFNVFILGVGLKFYEPYCPTGFLKHLSTSDSDKLLTLVLIPRIHTDILQELLDFMIVEALLLEAMWILLFKLDSGFHSWCRK